MSACAELSPELAARNVAGWLPRPMDGWRPTTFDPTFAYAITAERDRPPRAELLETWGPMLHRGRRLAVHIGTGPHDAPGRPVLVVLGEVATVGPVALVVVALDGTHPPITEVARARAALGRWSATPAGRTWTHRRTTA